LRDTLRNRAGKSISFGEGLDVLAQKGIQTDVFLEMVNEYEELGVLYIDPERTFIQLAE